MTPDVKLINSIDSTTAMHLYMRIPRQFSVNSAQSSNRRVTAVRSEILTPLVNTVKGIYFCFAQFKTKDIYPEAELKFEPRLKFETRLKYGWFHLNLYSMFQDLSRRSIETVFWWI